MTLFAIASVDEQPEDTIYHWSIREVLISSEMEKTHHIVGFIPWENAGRVTSAIQKFDPEKMLIVTKSGRIYTLGNEPGSHSDGEYVWKHWKRVNSAQHELDVTEQYYCKKT